MIDKVFCPISIFFGIVAKLFFVYKTVSDDMIYDGPDRSGRSGYYPLKDYRVK